jgi:catechol 2,3-dioxygenase-like lactoylglutathione lyase family enzyme
MIQVKRLGPVTLRTSDIKAMTAYYNDTVGLSPALAMSDRVVMATQVGYEAIILQRDDGPRLESLSFQISPKMSLNEAEQILKQQNLEVTRRTALTPGIAEAIEFTDPTGTRVQLFAECNVSRERYMPRGVSPLKIGHVGQFVTDVKGAADFYCKVLGFRVSDWSADRAVFLRCGIDHHTINFFYNEQPRLHHVAFEVKDWAEMCRVSDFLAGAGFELDWGPGRHFIGHNIACYHSNFEKVRVEFYTEMDMMLDEDLGYFAPRPWHGDRPQVPKVWPEYVPRNYWIPGVR